MWGVKKIFYNRLSKDTHTHIFSECVRESDIETQREREGEEVE
jgi:hypothetical protein